MAEKQPKTLEELDALINKEYGTNTIIKMDGSNVKRVPVYSTKIPGLDYILGGGYGQGRIVEIYGPESSGKTTMALQAIASIQEDGGTCAFIDAEHSLDIYYARNLGVDVESLRVTQPETGEQSLSIVEMMAKSGLYNMVVVDSVSALTPQAEIEGEMGQSHVGLQARLMGQAMRKLRGICNRTNTTIIFINQLRMKIGVMFGNPETTSGGNALKFYASQRLDVRKKETIKGTEGDKEAVANNIRVKVVKNKIAPPFKQIDLVIRFGEGIDVVANVLDFAVSYGIIKKAGSWYSYKEERIGQGKEKATACLKENPNIYTEVEKLVYQELNTKMNKPIIKRQRKTDIKLEPEPEPIEEE